MDKSVIAGLCLVGLVLMFVGHLLGNAVKTFLAKKASSKAAKNGLKNEKDAEKLLKKLGYTVVQKQPPTSYTAVVDGAPHMVNLVGDLLVEKNGKTWLAEVKTGKAAKLEEAATRRQLLEYQVAFGVDQMLLVDMEAKVLRTVTFLPAKKGASAPLAAKKKRSLAPLAVAAVLMVAGYLIARGGKSTAPVHADEPALGPDHFEDEDEP